MPWFVPVRWRWSFFLQLTTFDYGTWDPRLRSSVDRGKKEGGHKGNDGFRRSRLWDTCKPCCGSTQLSLTSSALDIKTTPSFHLLKNVFYFPLLAFKGIYNYWKLFVHGTYSNPSR